MREEVGKRVGERKSRDNREMTCDRPATFGLGVERGIGTKIALQFQLVSCAGPVPLWPAEGPSLAGKLLGLAPRGVRLPERPKSQASETLSTFVLHAASM